MIRVRIAPSPTGLLHIGTVRTALYNYLFAKKNNGKMVLRIEDTDKTRSTKEFEENIIKGLEHMGIAGDENPILGGNFGPYRQSERTEIYSAYIKKLLDNNNAYYCFCSKERLENLKESQRQKKEAPRYDGKCAEISREEAEKRIKNGESAVIRLRVPKNKTIIIDDIIKGKTVIESKELDDFVIAKKIDEPLYNLTVVIDDYEMQISHVIRGEDHLSNTAKQIVIYEILKLKTPKFAHLPLILNEDKSKLSKRKNKVSMIDYLDNGYLEEAILNFLALLGWNTSDKQEIFSMDELIEKFDLERVHKGGAIFDIKKLDWINGEYIKKEINENLDNFINRIKNQLGEVDLKTVKKILKDKDFEGRFKKVSEIKDVINMFNSKITNYEKSLIMNEKFKITEDILNLVLNKAIEKITNIEWEKADSSRNEELSNLMISIVSELNLKNGQVLWPIRVALSGLKKSPNFSTLMVYLGKKETLNRLNIALQKN